MVPLGDGIYIVGTVCVITHQQDRRNQFNVFKRKRKTSKNSKSKIIAVISCKEIESSCTPYSVLYSGVYTVAGATLLLL